MFPHNFDQMCQRSQVSRVTLLKIKVKDSEWLSQWVSDKVAYLAVRWWLKNIFGLIWDEGFLETCEKY